MKFTRVKGAMNYSEAVAILRNAKLEVLKDQTFGDSELYWMNDEGKEIAHGYFGDNPHVVIGENIFEGDTARNLRDKFKSQKIEYNE